MFTTQPNTMGDIFTDWGELTNNPGSWGGTPSIGVIQGPTVYGSEGGGGWWDNFGDDIFGIGSQIISAWGRNPTQQIGTVPGVGQGYSPSAILQSQAQITAAQQQALAQARAQGQAGGANSLDGIASSITSTISNNPLIFAAGAVMLFLLFKQPPGRR